VDSWPQAPAPGGPGPDRHWWAWQVFALIPAVAGSLATWTIAGLSMGLFETQGCGPGGDPAPGTRCPSTSYFGSGLVLYALPALLWGIAWFLPHQVRWRWARIALGAVAALIVICVPLYALDQAFGHEYTVPGW
jgi:hypothetical protein